ncbi:hypothetical protein PV08_03495 [Exophiala spinifera]|uniref:Uncharacterized protein n=1 Tax=Exophiala spinifera TaxID=91928 RepID=A0A0D1YV83_9EURO|nr:uncharacterized protein PV08_03495 [Exophiala spinifera]KIW19201.1 hypothetical protein PV08_03495 [Exophiala spinifera]
MWRARSRGRNRRGATVTPQNTQSPWKPVVDLTGDTLPVSASAPTPRVAPPLAPASGSGYKTNNATTIEAPLDPKQSPAYLLQQMALLGNRARVRPSFSSKVRPGLSDSGTSSELGPEDKENTPTPHSNTRIIRPNDNKSEKKSRAGGSLSSFPIVSSDDHQDKTRVNSKAAASKRDTSVEVVFQETRKKTDDRRARARSSESRTGGQDQDENDNHENTSNVTAGVEADDGPERPRKKPKSKTKSKKKKSTTTTTTKKKNKHDNSGQQGEEGENTHVNVEAESESGTVGNKNKDNTGKSKKRKRDRRKSRGESEGEAEAQAERQEKGEIVSSAEAKALKQLREILPSKRVSRVETQLRLEMAAWGCEPTETTVLVTTARDTVIDLARQQVVQTERSYQAIQAELLRMLKEQNKKLRRWERRAKTTNATNTSSTPAADTTPHVSESGIGTCRSGSEVRSTGTSAVVCSSSEDKSGSDSEQEEADAEEEEEQSDEEEEEEADDDDEKSEEQSDDEDEEMDKEEEKDASPRRKKQKRSHGHDRHGHHALRNRRSTQRSGHRIRLSPVSPVSHRRRAATEDPQPRASTCQGSVQ